MYRNLRFRVVESRIANQFRAVGNPYGVQVGPSVRVLVVTLFEDDDSVFMALKAGARVRAKGRRRGGDGTSDPGSAQGGGDLQYGGRRKGARLLRHPTFCRAAPSLSNTHRARARDPEPHRPRTPQPRHRETAPSEPQDRGQLRLEHLHQAASC